MSAQQDTTILLVDGDIHGHYSIDRFIERYWDKIKDKYPSVQCEVELDNHDYWNDRHDEQFREFASIIDDMIADSEIYVTSLVDGDSWLVQWSEGDIIAINPNASWCDRCEQWELDLPDNVLTYNVHPEFLSALINGDVSRLSDDEIEALDRFEKRETENMNNYHWSYNSDHTNEFDECEITGMRGNTVELHLIEKPA